MVFGSAFLFILAGALTHVVVGGWVASPWVLPDLTLVAICVAASESSIPALEMILLSSALPMLVSPGSSWEVGASYAAAAALWRWAATRWDVSHGRVAAVGVAVLETGLVLWWIGRAGAWSWDVWMALPLRVAMTALSMPLVKRWGARIRSASCDA